MRRKINMDETKTAFEKIAVRQNDKREFAIICAAMGKSHVDAFSEMLKIYKIVTVKRGTKRPRNVKNVPVVDVISHKDNSLPKS